MKSFFKFLQSHRFPEKTLRVEVDAPADNRACAGALMVLDTTIFKAHESPESRATDLDFFERRLGRQVCHKNSVISNPSLCKQGIRRFFPEATAFRADNSSRSVSCSDTLPRGC